MKSVRLFAAIASVALLASGLALAADAPATTRFVVTYNKVKPGSADAWRKVYQESVIPAFKKAGIASLSIDEVIFGDRPMFVVIRPLEKFAELDGPGPFQRAGLSQKQIDSLNAARNATLVSEERYVATALNEFIVPAGPGATVTAVQFIRPFPGKGEAFRALLRSDLVPAMQQAKQAGRISGSGVATSGQGKPGLYILWTEYPNLAALDGGNLLQQTMGGPAYALFIERVQQLAAVEEGIVTRSIPELTYTTN